jgi:hypothetical protein
MGRSVHVDTTAAAARVAPTRSCFRFENWTIDVTTPDPADLRWLAGFLDPSFEEVPGAPADCWVELVIDRTAYRRLARLGRPGHGPLVEGFANDAKPAWLERWARAASATIFHQDRHGLFYVVADDAAHVMIFAAERTPRCRVTMMRVVRELAMNRVVATGDLLVHGAAIAVSGGVVVICGPKGSGKTTLLMSMLRTGAADYVANDRCVLRPDGTGLRVRGLPTLVSIRRDTLAWFPSARSDLERLRPDLFDPDPAPGPRYSVSPPEFCHLFGDCRRVGGGPLRALLFPRITDDPRPLSVGRLEPPAAAERVRAGLFRAGQASPLGQAFVGAGNGSAVSMPIDPEWIAECVPSFACELGSGRAPGDEDTRALLRRVT